MSGDAAEDRHRRIEVIVGILFIIATASSSLGFAILEPILDDPDVLLSVAANEGQVLAGGFLLLIDTVAVVIIPVLLYPILRRHHEALVRLYPLARAIEAIVLVIGVVGLLSLVSLSRDYEETAVNAASMRSAADALVAIYDWGALLGVLLFFALAALILNYMLYRSRLIPRWLSGWGFVGGVLLLVEGLLEANGADNMTELLSIPIAVQEMVFAGWLIVKGFNPTAVASGTA